MRARRLVLTQRPSRLHVRAALADGRLVGLRNRRYGRTVVAIYVNRPSGKLDLAPFSEEFVGRSVADLKL